MIDDLKKDLQKLSNKKRATLSQKYFKTGVGEYGFGDVFIGLSVPQCRNIANKFRDLTFLEINDLLKSKIHEERLIALLILVDKFSKEPMEQRRIYEFYLKHTKYINNWDLVDLSAHKIVGGYLIDKPKEILYKMAKSKNLWEKRIAVIATFNFIKNKHYDQSLKIAEILLKDDHDLIQKAVGWMLREVGNRNLKTEEVFLKKYYKIMPRTTLRYAIEKFPKTLKEKYMMGKI